MPALTCRLLFTVTKGKIGSLITKLSSTRMHELHKTTDFALGFDEIELNYSISSIK